jgi:hypothetical protein
MNIKINNEVKELKDCKILGEVLEYMSGDEKMEKCFTFFNLNKLNNKTEKYFLDKSSFIDFIITFKNFGNTSITGKYKIHELKGLYIKVHSSQSLFSSSIQIPIEEIEFSKYHSHIVYNYKFSKSIARNLEWPYETDCHKNIMTHSNETFEDCVNSCILNNILIKNKCIPYYNNLSIDIGIDMRLKNKSLCKKLSENRIDDGIHLRCSRICHMDCITEILDFNKYTITNYSPLKKDFRYLLTTIIRIQSANSPVYEYELNSKLSFFNYASNLGGIISMWFGLAVIDTHKLFKHFFFILIRITRIFKFIEHFRGFLTIFLAYNCILLFISKLHFFLIKIRRIKWKFCVKFICLICFIQQSIEMTLEYLSFKTELNVESRNHFIGGIYESLPAMTICDFDIENVRWFEVEIKTPIGGEHLEKQFKNKMICSNNKNSNCTIETQAFIDILKNQTTVSDYLIAKEFWYNKVSCRLKCLTSEMSDDCESKSESISSYWNTYKCFTCFSKLNNDVIFNEKVVEFEIVRTSRETEISFIHDAKHLPTLLTSKISPINKQVGLFLYDKIRLNRLPAPYETDCDHYDDPIKSQAQCFNQLIEELYLSKNCLPKNSEKLTYYIVKSNLTNYGHQFCVNVTIDYDENILMTKCKKACKEDLFFVWESANNDENSNEFETVNKYFISFYFVPKLDFVNYLVNLGGLLGLWHGISLIDLKNLLMIKIQRIFSRLNLNNLSNVNLFLIKMLKVLQKYAKVKVF